MNNYGELKVFFAVDCETSGINFTSNDITEGYQSIAWGVIAVDAKTFNPIDKIYLEIKWDGVSEWSNQAERVHGLTKSHLEENGVDKSVAADTLIQFIYDHIEPEDSIILLGQNVARFHLPFLRKLFEEHGYSVKFSQRQIDSFTIGFVTLDCLNSDHLFQTLGVKRKPSHNALSDAEAFLKSVRLIRKIFKDAING
jgi:oligoribonuclease (3'-5' exoribonuclease)